MVRAQKFLVSLLLVALAVPLPGILCFRGRLGDWLANRTLSGVTIPVEHVPLSTRNWFDGSFQRSITQLANENFAGRELAIRLFNQALWSFCRKTYMHHEWIAAGTDDQLFEQLYLVHAGRFAPEPSDAQLGSLANDLARLKGRLDRYHVPFVVVFTPSKAVSLANDLPDRFQLGRKAHPGPFERERLKTLLQRDGVPVMDGAELTRSVGPTLPLPPFPKTGIHWTDIAAFHTAEATLRLLEKTSGNPLPHLTISDVRFTDQPRRPDADLLLLLNLVRPKYDHYAYGTISREPGDQAMHGRLVVVGGSFVHALNRAWNASPVWDEINHFFFSLSLIKFPGNISTPIDLKTVDWAHMMGAADAVVIEINESIVGSSFLNEVLASTLTGLPDRPPPVMADYPASGWYLEESGAGHRWRWSNGNATISLHLSATSPVRLSAQLKASHGSGHARIIGPDGTVLWSGAVDSEHFTTVQSEPIVHAGNLVLRLESDLPPFSPGQGDNRNLGLGLWDAVFK